MVKEMISAPTDQPDPAERLRSEKQRLERWIERLQLRLQTVSRQLQELEGKTERGNHGIRRQR
jgi:prefoldin subunit 5